MTPLTSAQFHILLTLAEGRRHGYGIMQEILRRTDGAMELGPGTLYPTQGSDGVPTTSPPWGRCKPPRRPNDSNP